jgi:hypothetical protein
MIAQRALHITMNDQMCSDLESVVSTWLRPIVKAARIAEHTIKRSTFHADLNPIGKWTAGLSWGLGNRRPVPCTRWPRAVNEATILQDAKWICGATKASNSEALLT